MSTPKLLTIQEAAAMTNKSVSQMRWLRHHKRGPISAKLGGRVVYREEDVLEWIDDAFEQARREQVSA